MISGVERCKEIYCFMISRHYKCFGCDKQHTTYAAAAACCQIVQHVWECDKCGAQFARSFMALAHAKVFEDRGCCPAVSGQNGAFATNDTNVTNQKTV